VPAAVCAGRTCKTGEFCFSGEWKSEDVNYEPGRPQDFVQGVQIRGSGDESPPAGSGGGVPVGSDLGAKFLEADENCKK